jgi:pimeloyl-ACP methyl ester carboxylesterase
MAFAQHIETVSIAGIKTELVTLGSGQPVLFLHGAEGVEASMPFLQLLAGSFKVYAPSHPGFGVSDLPAWMERVDDLAYHYVDFIAHYDLRDLLVVGVSFGGWVATELAATGTERMGRMVLADSFGMRFAERDVSELADIFFYTREELARLAFKGESALPRPATLDDALRIARSREALSLFGWSPYLHNPKLRHRVHRITAPTLVLWGAEDKIAPPAYGKAFAAALPNAEFKLVQHCGHYPHLEQSETVLQHILEFSKAPMLRNATG